MYNVIQEIESIHQCETAFIHANAIGNKKILIITSENFESSKRDIIKHYSFNKMDKINASSDFNDNVIMRNFLRKKKNRYDYQKKKEKRKNVSMNEK